MKSQFERIFPASDWRLFKEMAEVFFSEAAFLKKTDFKKLGIHKRLLVRNSRKRLFIGIGTELLLKAVYLKNGYCINEPKKGQPHRPFKPAEMKGVSLDGAKTYKLDTLINQLSTNINLQQPSVVADGLKIAKVFRNKEGHVVTPSHKFEPNSFRAIEKALVGHCTQTFFAKGLRFAFPWNRMKEERGGSTPRLRPAFPVPDLNLAPAI